MVQGNRYYQTIATINSPRGQQHNGDKKWVLFCVVVGASVVASTRRRTFHKRIQQCIQSELFQAAFFGGLPRFRLVGESDVPPSPTSSWGEVGFGFGGLPLLRFAGGSPVGLSSGRFLGCINHGESAPGGAWGRGRGELRRSSAEHTLGGLPLFLFSPAAGATSDVEAAVPAALFLFLLPLGRPRPRFAGVDARPKGGTIDDCEHKELDKKTRVIDRRRAQDRKRARKEKRRRGPTGIRVACQLSTPFELIG